MASEGRTTGTASARKRTRIQQENEARIIASGLDVFSRYGYRGSTVEQIATGAGMSKANVLYYFRRKEDIYSAVLLRTLATWLDPLEHLDATGDPVEELWCYARKKLALSRDAPHASRLFASEIMQGAPVIEPFLRGKLKRLVTEKSQVIQAWIDDGRLVAVEPLQLIFLIWAATQHYADFEVQIQALHGDDKHALYAGAEQTLKLLLTRGLTP